MEHQYLKHAYLPTSVQSTRLAPGLHAIESEGLGLRPGLQLRLALGSSLGHSPQSDWAAGA
jgi:hypothetical protein